MPQGPDRGVRLADLTGPQQAAIRDAAHEPAPRQGRLVISTTGRRYTAAWTHPQVADALVRAGLFRRCGDEILFTDTGWAIAEPIIQGMREKDQARAARARDRQRRKTLGIPVDRRGLTVVPDPN